MKPKKNGCTARATTGPRLPKATAVRSAKSRCKARWNPHKYLVAAARRVFRWSPEKKAAAELCSVDASRRRCAGCQVVYPRKQVHMDHIIPVGKQPREWADYPSYYERLFCAASNIQGLCRRCHKTKTRVDIKEMHQQ